MLVPPPATRREMSVEMRIRFEARCSRTIVFGWKRSPKECYRIFEVAIDPVTVQILSISGRP